MLTAFKKGRTVLFKDQPEPRPQAGQILVRVRACGVCGTDLHENPGTAAQEAVMTGHEIAGEVLELGPGVTGLTVGQKIVLDSATPCGRCDACRNARQELCTDIQSFFFLNSFGYAEKMIAPAVSAMPCADLAPEVATLQEPLGVAIDLVRLADLQPGLSNVLILGQGPIGLMATALAKRAGARRIFTTELASRGKRIELSRRFGADVCFDPAATPVEKYDFGCAIDRILVTAPPKTLNGAFAVAAKGAIISFIGIAFGDGANVTFDANDFHFKKLQLRASFASPALFGAQALQFLREGVIDGPALLTHTFPLARLQEALDTARSNPDAIKVAVNP
ncbi:MAG: alcohol dehydrogenase catalytic domain-containing protein [Lentisphaeria bacterium]